jgi:hypothetical protein
MRPVLVEPAEVQIEFGSQRLDVERHADHARALGLDGADRSLAEGQFL